MKNLNLKQFQRLDPQTGENLGGLYVSLQSIAAIYFDFHKRQTYLVLTSGKEFVVAGEFSQTLEEINLARLD